MRKICQVVATGLMLYSLYISIINAKSFPGPGSWFLNTAFIEYNKTPLAWLIIAIIVLYVTGKKDLEDADGTGNDDKI